MKSFVMGIYCIQLAVAVRQGRMQQDKALHMANAAAEILEMTPQQVDVAYRQALTTADNIREIYQKKIT